MIKYNNESQDALIIKTINRHHLDANIFSCLTQTTGKLNNQGVPFYY